MKLVKYKCGCIGLPPDPDSHISVILQACEDGGRDGPCFRDMCSSIYTTLEEPESRNLWNSTLRQCHMGQAFEEFILLITRYVKEHL